MEQIIQKEYKIFNNDWDRILKDEIKKDYFIQLIKFIDYEYDNKICFPKKSDIFNALKLTPFSKIKVVIIGQDPYHGKDEAHGLSFSVKEGIKTPPSLRNILKELENDLGIARKTTDLTGWALQGVLLINSILSVVSDTPLSHKDKGWEIFTDEIIRKINNKNIPVVFILWGSYAKSKKQLITNPIHFVIESSHPSPLSAYRGFFGSKPFSKTNQFLKSKNIKPIDWN